MRVCGEAFVRDHALSPQQLAVLRDIARCRTPALGGHADVCLDCGHAELAYNSCRNRHCPTCQGISQAIWIAQRTRRVLPTHHFHVVFTLPHQLNRLCQADPERLYGILFGAASQTLLDLGRDPKRLGARLGITAVLHTWTRDLRMHPHLHCIVTGGGLAPDDQRWIEAEQDYLFPVRVLSSLFKGKLLDALKQSHRRGELRLPGDMRDAGNAFNELMSALYVKDWVVYAKRPFGGPIQVFQYLGRYTHRVAISNQRLQHADADIVRFATKNGRVAKLKPEVFLQRFLLHVLPYGFTKIRHYGLLAPANVNTKLQTAKKLLEAGQDASPAMDTTRALMLALLAIPRDDWKEILRLLTGIDLSICPSCGQHNLRRVSCPRDPTDQISHLGLWNDSS